MKGDFNLATVSFPIKCMVGKSGVERTSYDTCYFPLYINLAVKQTNYVEKMKYVVVSCLSNFIINC